MNKKQISKIYLSLVVFFCTLLLAFGLDFILNSTLNPPQQNNAWLPNQPSILTNRAYAQSISQNSFAPLVEKVKPAVVNISTTKEVKLRRNRALPFDPYSGMRRDGFQRPSKKLNHSLGTGFIISPEGYILTNNHVIEGADEIIVTLDDGQELQAKLVGRDPKTDIAVLKFIQSGDYPYLQLADSEKIRVGDWVLAIGNPFGLGHTVTSGIVSAKARVLGAGPYDDFIQIDASINPGNSGGPLFDMQGRVIGINTAIIATGQGLGFAIPINMAKDLVPELIELGRIERGWLGVSIRETNARERQAYNLKANQGIVVVDVFLGSAAHKAGILPGDIILSFNNQAIDGQNLLPGLVGRLKPETPITLNFLRKGKGQNLEFKLGKMPNENEILASTKNQSSKVNRLGFEIKKSSQGQRGLLVTKIVRNSIADQVGLKVGDLIFEFDGRPALSVEKFLTYVGQKPKNDILRLGIIRGQGVLYFAFRL